MFTSGWQPSSTGSIPNLDQVTTQGNTTSNDVFVGQLNATKVIVGSTGKVVLEPDVVDSATAIASIFDTKNSLATAGAKLFSFRNAGVEKIYADYLGRIYVYGISTSGGTNYFDNQKILVAAYTMNTVAGAGITTFYNGPLALYNNSLTDSATAVGIRIDTNNPLTTSGAKLVSVNNDAAEKFHIDKDGFTMMANCKFKGYTSSASDPSLTELPNNNDFCFHQNTTTATLYLAFNLSGTIKKVSLT